MLREAGKVARADQVAVIIEQRRIATARPLTEPEARMDRFTIT